MQGGPKLLPLCTAAKWARLRLYTLIPFKGLDKLPDPWHQTILLILVKGPCRQNSPTPALKKFEDDSASRLIGLEFRQALALSSPHFH